MTCERCDKQVSANKRWCKACCEEMGVAVVTQRNEEPMEGITHILMTFDSKPQEDLYRADGMLVASRQADVVRFGHDIATAQSRLFLNEDQAKAWLRRLADVDILAQDLGQPMTDLAWSYQTAPAAATIEARNAETLLTLPGKHTSVRMN